MNKVHEMLFRTYLNNKVLFYRDMISIRPSNDTDEATWDEYAISKRLCDEILSHFDLLVKSETDG